MRCDLRTQAPRPTLPSLTSTQCSFGTCGSGTFAINTSNTSNVKLACAAHVHQAMLTPSTQATCAAAEYQTSVQVAAKYPQGGDHRLHAGELATAFGLDHGFEVLRDDVHSLADGRLVSYFLARKLAPGAAS